MTTDLTLMGPHALASYHSRLLALRAFGIPETSLLDLGHEARSLAHYGRVRRELVIQGEMHLTTI